MIFKPNTLKNYAVMGIILVLPIFISMVMPNIDPHIIFGVPTIFLIMYLVRLRSKLQYEIENDQLILISRDHRRVIPIKDIECIYLQQTIFTQYFITYETKRLEIGCDLVNPKGESVIDILTREYNIPIERISPFKKSK